MAFTVTKYPTVFGNKRAVGMKITADAATQAVESGLEVIEWFNFSIASMNSANIKLAANSTPSGVSSPGTLGISGCTSGDLFYVTVYGR